MSKKPDIGDRSLPSFDNHYNNGVLIENWQESRIYDATGRLFTLAMDHQVGPSTSIYASDYVKPEASSNAPMMRRRGLGKELMFGTGKPTTFEGVPTSTTYGASQRTAITSNYKTSSCSPTKNKTSFDGIPQRTFSDQHSKGTANPTADDNIYGHFSTTKTMMDAPVECYQFQRNMMHQGDQDHKRTADTS
ncbi:uncharacterized protein TM35_000082330 [Trypanosoma theileri]|uniref:Uncharacterized protein n=1 Tax=Trypanosoma theileri TaxID=67003 RepID=A0A1X0P0J7_9TRYP|nr:uncharacterized protein TM35_000082330 [Trypanosoma theileri]ORC90435.1 hypothetical protein TM35_000082330 [Trypanosoma theileri]